MSACCRTRALLSAGRPPQPQRDTAAELAAAACCSCAFCLLSEQLSHTPETAHAGRAALHPLTSAACPLLGCRSIHRLLQAGESPPAPRLLRGSSAPLVPSARSLAELSTPPGPRGLCGQRCGRWRAPRALTRVRRGFAPLTSMLGSDARHPTGPHHAAPTLSAVLASPPGPPLFSAAPPPAARLRRRRRRHPRGFTGPHPTDPTRRRDPHGPVGATARRHPCVAQRRRRRARRRLGRRAATAGPAAALCTRRHASRASSLHDGCAPRERSNRRLPERAAPRPPRRARRASSVARARVAQTSLTLARCGRSSSSQATWVRERGLSSRHGGRAGGGRAARAAPRGAAGARGVHVRVAPRRLPRCLSRGTTRSVHAFLCRAARICGGGCTVSELSLSVSALSLK